MMRPRIVREILSLIEAQVASRPSPIEYEMAYQVRVAIDRIRFAITQVERMGGRHEGFPEAALQLLDALDRLKTADVNFQAHFRGRRVSCRSTQGPVQDQNRCSDDSTAEAT
jgi:hypothetical protein